MEGGADPVFKDNSRDLPELQDTVETTGLLQFYWAK